MDALNRAIVVEMPNCDHADRVEISYSFVFHAALSQCRKCGSKVWG